MVAFSQVKPNTIKLRGLPQFPSRVTTGTGLSFERANGGYDFAIDFSDLERDDAITPTELAGLYVAAWNGTEDTFRLYLGSSLKGDKGDQGNPGPPTASDYQHKAQVQAATISGAVQYLRIAGYTAAGDGGAALYKKVGSQPSHNGKIQSADGAWWEIAEILLRVEMFGGGRGGTIDNLQPTLSALGVYPSNQCVYFGPGKYKFSANLPLLISNIAGAALVGCGPDMTELTWPNGGGGITLTNNSGCSKFQLRGLAMTTGIANSGIGVLANYTDASVEPINISNVVFRGASTYFGPEYWNAAMQFSGAWNIQLDDVYVGGGGAAALGNGLSVEGQLSPSVPTGVLNIQGCTFDYLATGIAYLESFQGVSINDTNLTGCQDSIVIGASSVGATQQDQLTITGSQIAPKAGGTGILIIGALRDLMVNSTLFLFGGGATAILALPGSNLYFASIIGNNFGSGIGNTEPAIHIWANGPNNAGTIMGNNFFGPLVGTQLEAGTSGWNVQGNAYNSVTTHVVNSAGAANSIGVATN